MSDSLEKSKWKSTFTPYNLKILINMLKMLDTAEVMHSFDHFLVFGIAYEHSTNGWHPEHEVCQKKLEIGSLMPLCHESNNESKRFEGFSLFLLSEKKPFAESSFFSFRSSAMDSAVSVQNLLPVWLAGFSATINLFPSRVLSENPAQTGFFFYFFVSRCMQCRGERSNSMQG